MKKTLMVIGGIDAYISEFSTWFSTNTTGSCK